MEPLKMIPMAFLAAESMIPSHASHSAYHAPAYAAEGRAIEGFALGLHNGTGGEANVHFFLGRHGYRPFAIHGAHLETAYVPRASPFAELMIEIRDGFGRTMTRLPRVFGVSRQSLYNWLDGETPKDIHREKLVELAAAAREFRAAGFKPTSDMLDRTIENGQTFLEGIANGANGAQTARTLMAIVNRGLRSQKKVDAWLAEGPAVRPVDLSDFATPSADEET